MKRPFALAIWLVSAATPVLAQSPATAPAAPFTAPNVHTLEPVRTLHDPGRLRRQGSQGVGWHHDLGGRRRQGHGGRDGARRAVLPVLHDRGGADPAVGRQGALHR